MDDLSHKALDFDKGLRSRGIGYRNAERSIEEWAGLGTIPALSQAEITHFDGPASSDASCLQAGTPSLRAPVPPAGRTLRQAAILNGHVAQPGNHHLMYSNTP